MTSKYNGYCLVASQKSEDGYSCFSIGFDVLQKGKNQQVMHPDGETFHVEIYGLLEPHLLVLT